VGEWLKSKRLTVKVFKKIFVDAKWVMLGSLALALFATGQYFVIGLFEDKESLGIYFFGFQLVIVVSAIITSAIETVFLPVLTSLPDKHYKTAYITTLFFISSISLIISVLGFINAEWVISFVWKGKWDQSILVIQVLILTMPAVLLTNFNKVVMESKGLWGKRLINLGLFVTGDIIVAGFSSWKYDIYLTAIMICCYRNIFSFFQCLWMTSVVNISIKKLLGSVVPNVLLMLLLSLGSFLAINYFQYINNSELLRNTILSFSIVFLFLLFNLILEKKRVKQFQKIRD
jgi:O-antigen/teichoic acid export membrane protein